MSMIEELRPGECVVMRAKEYGGKWFQVPTWIQHFIYNASYHFHADIIATEVNRRNGYAMHNYTGQIVDMLKQHIRAQSSITHGESYLNRHWYNVTRPIGLSPGRTTALQPSDLGRSRYQIPDPPEGTVLGYLASGPYEAQRVYVYPDGRRTTTPPETPGRSRGSR